MLKTSKTHSDDSCDVSVKYSISFFVFECTVVTLVQCWSENEI